MEPRGALLICTVHIGNKTAVLPQQIIKNPAEAGFAFKVLTPITNAHAHRAQYDALVPRAIGIDLQTERSCDNWSRSG